MSLNICGNRKFENYHYNMYTIIMLIGLRIWMNCMRITKFNIMSMYDLVTSELDESSVG